MARKLLTTVIIFSSLLFTSYVNANEIKIGLRAHNGVSKALKQWQLTADYLSQAIPEHKFVIVPIVGINELMEATGREEFDFVLTNPSSAVEMEIIYGVSQIVTLKNKRQGKPYTHFGSVIFTLSSQEDINSIHDFKGRSIVAVSEHAFGGWRVALRELLHNNIKPEKVFSKISFSGGIQEDVVFSVLNGQYDIGVVRTDMLERMAASGAIQLSDFKIINQKQTEGFPFAHSTQLYPEWPFSKLKKTPNNLAQKVALALLTIPQDHPAAIAGKYVGWTVIEDYEPVRELLMELRAGPYSDYGEISTGKFIRDYQYWIYAFITIFLFIISLSIIVISNNRKLNVEKTKQQQTNLKLAERIKELNCLYSISKILEDSTDMPCAFNRVVDVLPASWQYPDMACARITYKNLEFTTENFSNSHYRLSAEITENKTLVGNVEILYNDDIAQHDIGPFLKEESALIIEIGRRLSIYLDSNYINNELHQNNINLEERVLERTKELNIAKEEAVNASIAKTEFLSKMSHELRTPLNAILGFSQLLLTDEPVTKNPTIHDHVLEIKHAGDHLLLLINDILDLSRIEAGKYEIDIQSVELDKLVDECIKLISPIATNYKVNISSQFKCRTRIIQSDYRALKQILLNLSSNAIKYNHKNGQVNIVIQQDDKSLIISVIDNGPGIPEDKQKKLFNIFERLDRNISEEGTGIGLAIVRGLIEQLGGSLGVESKEGEGSCFWFSLPHPVKENNVLPYPRQLKSIS